MMNHVQPAGMRSRNPILAAVLSALAPGLGQAYAGHWKRGAALLVGISAQIALFYGVEMPALTLGANGLGTRLPVLVPFLLPVWVWAAYDAYWTARGRTTSGAAPVLLVLVLNLVAAWIATDIRRPELGPEQRGVVRQILGGLATPDVAARRTTEQTATGKYIVRGPGAGRTVEPVRGRRGSPTVVVEPLEAQAGTELTVSGSGFAPRCEGKLILLGADEMQVATLRTRADGKFRASFVNPRDIPGEYFVQARAKSPGRGWQLSETLGTTAPLMVQTIYLALIGTALSLIVALPLSFFGARNLMSGSPLLRSLYSATRGVFTILRSVEVLIFAVLAVAVVGIGPFAGVIALAVHGIGALGKLYSEAIESIDRGPIEAVRATGASELQVVLFAVVPQVVPQFIAFTLYRWDINVRMATVIGLVGGGGIGFQLIQYMNLFQWRQAATAIWLIAGVVMLMDYASAVIREKVV